MNKKTKIEKLELSPFFIDSNEQENDEIIKIIESGVKKTVSKEFYEDNYYHGDCEHCMNYDYKNDKCKKNVPEDIEWDICEEWDYIYKTEDEE